MGIYKILNKLWRDKKKVRKLLGDRLIQWRKENAVVKIKRPTRISKARSLGYKAKQGILMARVRVKRGGRKKPKIRKGRRPKRTGRKKIVGKSYQWIAEERANRKFHNFEVLNSYYLAQDGKHYWFEIIMIDPYHPAIKKDKHLKWICEKQHTGRVYRGLTSAAHKSRGLRHKGKGAEKMRPSLRAHDRRGK